MCYEFMCWMSYVKQNVRSRILIMQSTSAYTVIAVKFCSNPESQLFTFWSAVVHFNWKWLNRVLADSLNNCQMIIIYCNFKEGHLHGVLLKSLDTLTVNLHLQCSADPALFPIWQRGCFLSVASVGCTKRSVCSVCLLVNCLCDVCVVLFSYHVMLCP